MSLSINNFLGLSGINTLLNNLLLNIYIIRIDYFFICKLYMSELIIRKIIGDVGQSSQIIIDNFNKLIKSNANIYTIIDNIPKYNKLYYIFIFIGILFFTTRYDIKLNFILGILLSVILIHYLISKDNVLQDNFIEDKDLQLRFLNNLLFDYREKYVTSVINDNFNINPPFDQSYLYLNPLIIQFFYNTRENSQYNLSNYVNSLSKINEILGLSFQMNIGLENPYQNYKTLKKLYNDALNSYHSIIYSIPSDKIVYKKFNNSLKILQSLLIKHLDDARVICKLKNNEEEINIDTLPDSILDSNINEDDTKTNGFSYNYSFF